jgi:hypothetical protein
MPDHRHTTACTRGMTPEEKVLHYLPERPEGQCWLWTGAVHHNGYGVLKVNARQTLAHRLAHEVWVGPIPDGLVIDHVKARGCTSTLCCNPAHLEPVTNAVNLLRGDAPPARHARQETCTNGHSFDATKPGRGGKVYRRCNQCIRDRRATERA